MADPRFEIQKAIVAVLEGDAGVGALCADRIYDDVPAETVFPYLVIDDMQVSPENTMLTRGFSISVNIYAWSRYRGRKEVRALADAVFTALDRVALSLGGGFTHIDTQLLAENTFRDGDGLTYANVQTFRIRAE